METESSTEYESVILNADLWIWMMGRRVIGRESKSRRLTTWLLSFTTTLNKAITRKTAKVLLHRRKKHFKKTMLKGTGKEKISKLQ